MEVVIGAIIGILIGALISGAVLWIVSKFNLGLKVENFGWAMIAGVVIGILNTLANMLVPGMTGILGAVINLVVAAVAIFIGGKILKGLTVDGFGGALLAAVVIAVIYFLIGMAAMGLVPAATS